MDQGCAQLLPPCSRPGARPHRRGRGDPPAGGAAAPPRGEAPNLVGARSRTGCPASAARLVLR
eukprot:scaffold24140_cov56-Isochrysis_galbana.AAC.1